MAAILPNPSDNWWLSVWTGHGPNGSWAAAERDGSQGAMAVYWQVLARDRLSGHRVRERVGSGYEFLLIYIVKALGCSHPDVPVRGRRLPPGADPRAERLECSALAGPADERRAKIRQSLRRRANHHPLRDTIPKIHYKAVVDIS
ncbi:hypothetical protein [Streptosporangium canum]|uniref:hypothetical protein n=1 Tax=Streptosporangium canum TaxID=324952 RepID=UPI0037AABB8C